MVSPAARNSVIIFMMGHGVPRPAPHWTAGSVNWHYECRRAVQSERAAIWSRRYGFPAAIAQRSTRRIPLDKTLTWSGESASDEAAKAVDVGTQNSGELALHVSPKEKRYSLEARLAQIMLVSRIPVCVLVYVLVSELWVDALELGGFATCLLVAAELAVRLNQCDVRPWLVWKYRKVSFE